MRRADSSTIKKRLRRDSYSQRAPSDRRAARIFLTAPCAGVPRTLSGNRRRPASRGRARGGVAAAGHAAWSLARYDRPARRGHLSRALDRVAGPGPARRHCERRRRAGAAARSRGASGRRRLVAARPPWRPSLRRGWPAPRVGGGRGAARAVPAGDRASSRAPHGSGTSRHNPDVCGRGLALQRTASPRRGVPPSDRAGDRTSGPAPTRRADRGDGKQYRRAWRGSGAAPGDPARPRLSAECQDVRSPRQLRHQRPHRDTGQQRRCCPARHPGGRPHGRRRGCCPCSAARSRSTAMGACCSTSGSRTGHSRVCRRTTGPISRCGRPIGPPAASPPRRGC